MVSRTSDLQELTGKCANALSVLTGSTPKDICIPRALRLAVEFEVFRGLNQSGADAGFHGGVSRVGNNTVLGP